jgi:23S rRNA (guanosine2251-2'-O)-methyltransferase
VEDQGVVYGRNTVLEHLKAAQGSEGYVLHVSRKAHGKILQSIQDTARSRSIPVCHEDPEYFSRFRDARHQGVALEVPVEASPEDAGARSEESWLREVARERGLIVLLDQVTDPHNAGSILRTAEALGAKGVVMTRERSAAGSASLAKTSAGATAWLPPRVTVNLARFIDRAKEAGYRVIGAAGEGEKMPRDLRGIRPALLVIGSEGSGLRRLTGEKCDLLVRIPLRGKVESLNASVAAGILIYELLRD